MKARRTYDGARFGLAVSSFTLETLDGADERAATERAGPGANGVEVQEQLVAESLCQVAGEDVVRPYVPWSSWDARTRAFVRAAFHAQMGAKAEEVAAFLAKEQDGLFDARGLGLTFESIRLVPPNGHEELAAVRRAGDGASVFALTEELIATAIVEVDGEPAPRPMSWATWDLRTRAFVRAAHDHVTSLRKEELEDFLQAARAEEPGATAPASSASGRGSPGTSRAA